MRKIILMFVALTVTIAANAQFEKNKWYAGASLSGIGLSYNSDEEFKFALDAKGGYMFDDSWLALANVGYSKQSDVASYLKLGIGARYYFVKNGLYVGAMVNYIHDGNDHDDFMPGVHVGYAFFLSKTVTVEPEIYYDQSFKDSDYSTIGLRIGFGIYI